VRPHTVRRPRLALGDGAATRVSLSSFQDSKRQNSYSKLAQVPEQSEFTRSADCEAAGRLEPAIRSTKIAPRSSEPRAKWRSFRARRRAPPASNGASPTAVSLPTGHAPGPRASPSDLLEEGTDVRFTVDSTHRRRRFGSPAASTTLSATAPTAARATSRTCTTRQHSRSG